MEKPTGSLTSQYMNTATEPVQGVFIVFARSLDLKIHVLLAALAMAMAVASALAVGSTK